jgi:hypothetical protein
MTTRLRITLAACMLAFGLSASGSAVELDPATVVYKTPDQFKWRDPTNAAPNNQTILHGDPTKAGGIYVYINKFKPGRFGTPHYHPKDRFITVIEGAGWRGTGNIVDPAHARRLPKGSFSIDHALKVHWDGTKEESGAYLISGDAPATNIEVPPGTGPYAGGDPGSLTLKAPDEIAWTSTGAVRTANLAGDPEKQGIYVQMVRWSKGNFGRPHFYPNDRFVYVLDGTWWIGTGTKFDTNQTVAMKEGTFVTEFGKQPVFDGAKDEEATLVIVGFGPATSTSAEPK